MQINSIGLYPQGFQAKAQLTKDVIKYEDYTQQKEKHNNTNKRLVLGIVGVLTAGTAAYLLLKKGKVPTIEITPGGKTTGAIRPKLEKPDNIKLITTTEEFTPERLDEISSRNGVIKPDSWSFADMKKYYSELEQQEEKVVNEIKIAKETQPKIEFSPEKLDEYLEPVQKEGSWSPKDMKEYYENGCITQETLPDGSIVKKTPVTLDGRQTIITTAPNGTKTVRKTDKNGKYIEYTEKNDHTLKSTQYYGKDRYIANYYENGRLSKIVSQHGKLSSTTTLHGNIKTTQTISSDGRYTSFKIYEQDETGKFRCIKRETYDRTTDTQKIVEYIEDGKYSKTTVNTHGKETVTIRDKKGNIIDFSKTEKPGDVPPPPPAAAVKLLAPWYLDYLELCKKFGTSPRVCGVKGGAWDHYYELCLKRNDPKAYEKYLKLQEYRARYDSKAQLMEILRYGEKYGINPEVLKDLTEGEISELYKYISQGHIKLEDIKNMSKDEIRTLLKQVQAEIKRIEQENLERQRHLIEEQRRQQERQQQLVLLA